MDNRWTGFIDGKRTTKTVSKEEALECKRRIKNFRKLQKEIEQLLREALASAPWQIAKELGLSSPTVLIHVRALIESELLRESKEMERRYPAERFYEPNFPVVFAEERAEFEPFCQEIARQIADVFQKRNKQLQQIFSRTELAKRGWPFADLTQYVYACVQRAAREELEKARDLATSARASKWRRLDLLGGGT
jgi:hypothetical protein